MHHRRTHRQRTLNKEIRFEKLEDRRLLVTGAFDIPAAVVEGTGFDGVVQLTNGCTGSLIQSGQFTNNATVGRHILTAAHCLDDDGDLVADNSSYNIRFDIPGGPITFAIPQANITIHPNWLGEPMIRSGNDLAIMELPALAPVEAERFLMFTSGNTETIGATTTVVGYGRTGTGTSGDTRGGTEIQRLVVNATAGTYQLSGFGGMTNAIAFNASDATIETRLETDMPGIGDVRVRSVDQSPLIGGDPNIRVYEIRFDSFSSNVFPLGVIDNLTGTLAVTTIIDGGNAGTGVKRSANNSITGLGGAAPGYMNANNNLVIVSDMDDGSPGNNTGGDGLGQGINEGATGPGDSGGPSFENGIIAGVNSLSLMRNVWGDFDVFTRVSQFSAWIEAIVTAPDDILLDMNFQGQGGDNSTDIIVVRHNTIAAMDFVEIILNGSLAYRDLASRVNSLSIIGTSDDDAISITDLTNVADIDTIGGSDSVELSSGARVTGLIITQSGDDQITLNDTSRAAMVNTFAGNDIVTLNGASMIDGDLDVGDSDLSSQTNIVIFNGGRVDNDLLGDQGNDHINFSTVVSQSVSLTGIGSDGGFDGSLVSNLIGGQFRNIDKISGSSTGSTDQINGLNLPSDWTINNNNDQYSAGGQTLDFMNFENLGGGSDVDTFSIQATATELNLNGNGDNDRFLVTSDAPGLNGNASGITATLNIDGGFGNNQLFVADVSAPGNNNVVVTTNTITGLAPATINYTASGSFSEPENGIWLKGSAVGADDFLVASLLPGNTLRIDAGGGDDSIISTALALGDMQFNGEEGSDNVDIQFIDDLRRIDANDTGVGDNDTLILRGLAVADSFVVRITSVARNVTDRVWHDGRTENLEVHGLGGDDVVNFAESIAPNVTVTTGVGQDFVQIIDTGIFLTNLHVMTGDMRDVFRVLISQANTSIVAELQAGRDFAFVGSNLSMNNGSLDRILGPLSIDGGSNLGSEDRLYINDRATLSAQRYRINDSEVSSLSIRSFDSLSHSRFEVVRLDGTDFGDEFEVTPSFLNRFVVDGNLPTRHDIDCAAEGDFLNLVADANSGRHLILSDPDQGDGAWLFTNGFQGVFFTSIERFNHVARLAMGSDAFLYSEITVLDAETRDELFTISPFESTFTGGVRVATGDISGDGIPDIIAASGAGRIPEVRIYDGLNGQFLDSFLAYDKYMWDGILVTAGDVTGGCGVDIVTTTGPGPARAEIRVWENTGTGFQLADHFLPFGSNYYGGADVTVADFSGDGHNDIAAGALHGRGHVAIFDGTVPGGASEIARFQAFGNDFYGGVHVTAGQVIGSDTADLIVSTGYNAWGNQYDSRVHFYDGDNLVNTPYVFDPPDFQFNAFAANENPEASTRIIGSDHDLDGAIDELFVSHGPDGSAGEIRIFEPLNVNAIDSFFETGHPFSRGIFVG